ncbi:MAG: methyltransferase domain-containing protein, partial [Pseudomonadota bacterium]
MADPFQDVDAAGAEFITLFADAMDVRQAEPVMEEIVAAYLAMLPLGPDATVIEVGAGAGAVSRRIAAHAAPAKVIGFEPSHGFVAEARSRAEGLANLSFQQADGTDL